MTVRKPPCKKCKALKEKVAELEQSIENLFSITDNVFEVGDAAIELNRKTTDRIGKAIRKLRRFI